MADTGPPIAAIAAALQQERRRVGLSLAEVSRRAGIAKSTLSQLESGTGNPSLETLWALSVTLDVPFSRLVEPAKQSVRLIRAGEGPRFASDRADYSATLLASSPPNARRDIYLVAADVGEPRRSDPHSPGVVEHVVLSAGRALVGPVGEAVELFPGDYVAYPGDVLHIFEAMEANTMAVMITEHS